MKNIEKALKALGSALLLAGAGTLLPVHLAAQETVSLEDAIARALVRSPSMAQQDQSVGTAQLSHRTAWGAFLPSVSASTSGSLRSTQIFDSNTNRLVEGSSDSYSAGLSASFTLFQGGRRFSELDRADADLAAARARRENQRFQVTLQTKNAFFAALRQGDLLDVARQRVAQAEQTLELVRTQTRLGTATLSDSLRARLDVANAQQSVLQSETALRAARFALGRQIGVSQPVVPERPANLEPTPLGLTDAEVYVLAEEESPVVLAARESTVAAAADVRSAKTAWIPSLSFSSGYSWANQERSLSGGTTSWNLNLRASYPIFNGFQRESAIDRAQFSQRVARLQEDDALLAARQEADAALWDLRTAERAIEIAEVADVVAREDLRVVTERYRLSVATILDLVISQVSAAQAAANVVTARYDYLLARAQLEAVLGREL
jgi:outer membrane protein TolC